MPEETSRRIEDIERMARVEVEVRGLREDMSDFKEYMTGTVNAFMKTIGNMQKDYMPRSEIEKELALRDITISDLKDRADKQEADAKELAKRPSWHSILIVGLVGAGFGSIVLAFFELLLKHN